MFSQTPGARSEAQDICANHRRYMAMDVELETSATSIRCRFFAAAACVTHPRGGLGVLDRASGGLLFNAGEVAFLRHVHGALALLNQRWFERLRIGLEVPGCEGLRGRALDHALVGLEQSAFTRAMCDHFSYEAARQARVIGGINLALNENPILRSPLLQPPLRAALAAARRHSGIDLADEPQRRAIGQALVDHIAADGGLPTQAGDESPIGLLLAAAAR